MLQPVRPQMTIWRMLLTCRINKGEETHSLPPGDNPIVVNKYYYYYYYYYYYMSYFLLFHYNNGFTKALNDTLYVHCLSFFPYTSRWVKK